MKLCRAFSTPRKVSKINALFKPNLAQIVLSAQGEALGGCSLHSSNAHRQDSNLDIVDAKRISRINLSLNLLSWIRRDGDQTHCFFQGRIVNNLRRKTTQRKKSNVGAKLLTEQDRSHFPHTLNLNLRRTHTHNRLSKLEGKPIEEERSRRRCPAGDTSPPGSPAPTFPWE